MFMHRVIKEALKYDNLAQSQLVFIITDRMVLYYSLIQSFILFLSLSPDSILFFVLNIILCGFVAKIYCRAGQWPLSVTVDFKPCGNLCQFFRSCLVYRWPVYLFPLYRDSFRFFSSVFVFNYFVLLVCDNIKFIEQYVRNHSNIVFTLLYLSLLMHLIRFLPYL